MKVIVLLFAAGTLGVGFLLFSRMQPSMVSNTVAPETDSTTTSRGQNPTDNGILVGSNYVEYTLDSFSQTNDKKRVIFFYAAWCPTCRPADAEFKDRVSEIPTDVILFRANYDTESAIKKQYGITYQHTFVLVDRNGEALSKWNGGGIEELITNTQ